MFIVTVGAMQIKPDLVVAFGKYQLNQDTLGVIFNGMMKLGALLIAGIVLISVGKVRNLIYSMILFTPALFFFARQKFKSSFRKKLCEPVIAIIENIAQGFTLIKYPMKIFLCALISALIWGLLAFSYYLFSLGCPGINLTFLELSAVMVIICFFIFLPSVPGWWGLWEAGGVFALSLFGVSSKEAIGFTLANHAIQVIPVIIAGMASAMLLSVNIRQMSLESKEIRLKPVSTETD
jgi:uncharacterized membrane protein YbhN (UPF0104 family)